jgi:hypothetical protein
MKSISAAQNAWIDQHDGALTQYALEAIERLTAFYKGYPNIVFFKKRSYVWIFVATGKEKQADRDALARACIAAYQPDELVITYSANFGAADGSHPPQAMMISCRHDDSPSLLLLELVSKHEASLRARVAGEVANPEEIDFPYKIAAATFFEDQEDRRSEAQQALSAWRRDVAWYFELAQEQ